MLRELFQFLVSVLSLQFVLLGGYVLTVLVGLYEKYIAKQTVPLTVYTSVILVLLFFACFQAWQQEHRSRVGRETDLHSQEGLTLSQRIETSRENLRYEQCQGSLRETQNSFNRLSGAAGVQANQIQGQQNTINGCLTQAMKLLTPEPFHLTVLLIDSDKSKSAINTECWLLITNVPKTPVRMVMECNSPIQSASILPLGSAALGGTGKLNSTTWEATIQSPAWAPTLPLMATIAYRPVAEHLQCRFTLR